MGTSTNTLASSQSGSVDFLTKTPNANLADKVTSVVYKTDNYKVSSKTKGEDFKEVLNSKSSYKDGNKIEKAEKNDNTLVKNDNTLVKNDNVSEKDNISKIEELKKELKELEEKSGSTDTKEKVEDILTQLLNLISQFDIKDKNLKLDGEINQETLKNMLDKINETKASASNVDSIMEKLIELMKKDSVKNALDNDSLKSIKEILSKLSANLAGDNTEATKGIKSSMKNLLTEVSNILENKQNQNTKVLTLEDMLGKKYSQDNNEGSLGSEKNNSSSENVKNNKEVSKEDKFLNSLLDDKKDDSLNKINLFASRSQVIQNQPGDTVRGLTINKATFTNDLIRDVKFMSTNAMKELTVKVNPGNLGEITIKLIQEDGVMKANLKANSKEATAILSQNLAEIKKQLTEQNIKIADVNIELYQEDTTFFSEQGFGRQLSEEQGRNGSSKSNTISNAITTEEELNDNIIVSNNNNIEFFA
ncbi:flagellar hook-length control protein FliK [Clostridium sp. C2-6-12]|uniref:flagellar hook-length control protein FliK n=1 Tax=Clostridium sp. C2-6-12 TaxID=2698832 RepID=UPI0013722B89|nr:flagellar hook-length control protein FliK [Clostridium sp. C2-6-12]